MDSNEPFVVYPGTINHIAVSVSNLEEAIKWYQNILGFTLIKQPIEFVADDSLTGMAVKDFHGPKLKKMKIAWLTSANQVGFEIIEYVEPKAERRADSFEYWKSGITHISVTDPDIEGLCKRISDSGGKQRSKIWEIVPDKHYKVAFCEDPFGNIIEIYDIVTNSLYYLFKYQRSFLSNYRNIWDQKLCQICFTSHWPHSISGFIYCVFEIKLSKVNPSHQ